MAGPLTPVAAPAVTPGGAAVIPPAIKRAVEEFEASFIAQLLKSMPLGQEAGVFSDVMVGEYAKLVARSGGVGVADAVARELLALQENAR
jgi:peptidoglycan hydrolase FlgJ